MVLSNRIKQVIARDETRVVGFIQNKPDPELSAITDWLDSEITYTSASMRSGGYGLQLEQGCFRSVDMKF